MSTAVLISGQMRTFAQCFPTQRWQVFRHYSSQLPTPSFFVSCVDDENAHSADLLREHYANVHIERYEDPTDLEIPSMQSGTHAPYANAASHDKLMLQHWGNKKVWDFFVQTSESSGQRLEFRTFIRIRPDQFIHRFIQPNEPYLNECYCPWWGKFGGVNDRLAVMGWKAAESYFTLYDRIPALLAAGCPFHPESLLAASLLQARCSVRNLMASCSTLRENGHQRWPEVTTEDIAELIYGIRN